MSKLAVFGGDSVVPEGLVVHWPNVTQEDKAAVIPRRNFSMLRLLYTRSTRRLVLCLL